MLFARGDMFTVPVGTFICALKARLDSDVDVAATFPVELHKALLDQDRTLFSTAVAPSNQAYNVSQTPGFRFLGSLDNAVARALHPCPNTDVMPLNIHLSEVQVFLSSYQHVPFTSMAHSHLHFFIVFINAPVYMAAFPSLTGMLPLSQQEERRLTHAQQERISRRPSPYRLAEASRHILPVSSPSQPVDSHAIPIGPVLPPSATALGNTFTEVCHSLGVDISSLRFQQHRGKGSPYFEIVQLCLRVDQLLRSLGYRSGKGSLGSQSYTFADGSRHSFAEIVKELGWAPNEYQKKVNLIYWAQTTVANYRWRHETALQLSQGEQSIIAYLFRVLTCVCQSKLKFLVHTTPGVGCCISGEIQASLEQRPS